MLRLTKSDFRRLYSDARVVEADGFQLKVLRFSNGDYFKLFHNRRFFSSATFYPYSRRFARNARSLAEREVPTVSVQTLFRIPHLDCTAVRYTPLPGSTLRELAAYVDAGVAEGYGRFLAGLHQRGVYFRAVHPGNVVVMPGGDFGLIDIAQLSCHRFPLTKRQRRKNLQHVARSRLDQDFLRTFGEAILSGYESVAGHRPVRELAVLERFIPAQRSAAVERSAA